MTDAEGNEIGKLFVGGLSQATNNGSLRLHFSRFGEVEDGVVMMDNKTGRSRGFGYVKYRDSESVTLALEAKPHILDGKEVDAKQCNVNMKGRNRRSLKIFVGGIGLDQDADSIRAFFKQFGRVTDVNLMMDSNKQRHRGFAFVGFEDEVIVKRLISLHYVTMNNKQVEIKAMEPPNFGRKLTSTACLSAAPSLLASTSVVDGFEHLSESNGMFSAGLGGLANLGAYTNPHHTLLSQQLPGLQCTQHNFLNQPRPSLSLYEHQQQQQQPYAVFGNGLLQESMLPPATPYLQPTTPTQTLRAGSENVGAPANAINLIPSQCATGKQCVSMIVPGSHLNQPVNQLPHGNFIGFSPTGASIYATLPYNIVSPFVGHSQHATTTNGGQLLSPDKIAWGMGNSPLALYSPALTLQPSLTPCVPYSPNQPPTGYPPNAIGAVNNPSSVSITGFVPYYPVCSQHAQNHIQGDPNGPPIMHFTTATPSNTVCNLPNTQSAAGDASMIRLTTNSRPASPSNESKGDTGSGDINSGNLLFPTVMMPANVPHAIAGNVASSPMWNPSMTSPMIYPSMPLGWNAPAQMQPSVHQQWHHTASVLPHSADTATIPMTKSTQSVTVPTSLMTSQVICDAASVKAKPYCNMVTAKASGDTMDSLISSTDTTPNFLATEHAAGTESSKIGGFSLTKATPDGTCRLTDELKMKTDQMVGDQTSWNHNSGGVHSTVTLPLPPWMVSPNSTSGCPSRWNEMTPSSANFSVSSPINGHHQGWNISFNPLNGSGEVGDLAKQNSYPTVQMTLPTTDAVNCHSVQADCADQSARNEVLQRQFSSGNLRQQQAQPTDNSCSKQTSINKIANFQSGHSDNSPAGTTNASNSLRENLPKGTGNEDKYLNINSMNHPVEASSKNGKPDMVRESRPVSNYNNEPYSNWIYSSTHRLGSNDGNTTSTAGSKTIHSGASIGVELECQGPAGAAGDFHFPVSTRSHYTNYQIRH